MGIGKQEQENNLLEWAEQVKTCRDSGMTVSAWCEENGINQSTYYRRQRMVAAMAGKRYCDKLFAIEEKLKGLSPEERLDERRKQGKPVLDEFLLWVKAQKAAPKSGLGKAVYYCTEQWPYLERYLLDGRLEISNNRAERSIKPFVIRRKNFLFANTPRGADGSAVMYSIIETAKENGLDPYRYLAYIFREAPNIDLNNEVEFARLLPWNTPESIRTAAI